MVRYDDNPDGKLDVAEFAELIRDLEAGVVRRGDGDVPAAMAAFHPADIPPRVLEAFRYFDGNNSGFLDYRELRNALQHYGEASIGGHPEGSRVSAAAEESPGGD